MPKTKKSASVTKSVQPSYALLSVFDKTGIVDLAKSLHKVGYKIVSTGGTAKVLSENKIPVIPIQDITGNPESFDGRMKTISFQAEGGILYDRTNPDHVKQAEELNVPRIDIVVCNLYPFEQTVNKPNVKFEDAVENIDVGGPTMIRSAAKNHKNVLVVVDPKDYESVSNYIKRHPERSEGSVANATSDKLRDSLEKPQNNTLTNAENDKHIFRQNLAAKAFRHLSFYDSQIAAYLDSNTFPDEVTLPGRKLYHLRYGDNPHQQAVVYGIPNKNSPMTNLQLRAGREMSMTNLTDINAGFESVRMFSKTAAVVIKHNNPCGIALGHTPSEALERAIDADPESAFGGVVVMNEIMDLKAAEIIADFKSDRGSMMDIIAVPDITPDALELIKKVRKTTGVYTFGHISQLTKKDMQVKQLDGGFILQTPDTDVEEYFGEWEVVTEKKPTAKQISQMRIAWMFITRIKSNAIIIVDKQLPMTRGIGSGQTSRVRSTKIALEQAGEFCKQAVLASDSFFPFSDSVQLAAEKGIGAIVEQGGSVNDQASIDAANKAGIPMVFTKRRAFWH